MTPKILTLGNQIQSPPIQFLILCYVIGGPTTQHFQAVSLESLAKLYVGAPPPRGLTPLLMGNSGSAPLCTAEIKCNKKGK